MKCRSCQSAMVLGRRESSAHATTSWHQCPVCKQVRLTSECDQTNDRYSASTILHSDDDSRYAADFDPQPGIPYLLS